VMLLDVPGKGRFVSSLKEKTDEVVKLVAG
jgi:hypothetical protein